MKVWCKSCRYSWICAERTEASGSCKHCSTPWPVVGDVGTSCGHVLSDCCPEQRGPDRDIGVEQWRLVGKENGFSKRGGKSDVAFKKSAWEGALARSDANADRYASLNKMVYHFTDWKLRSLGNAFYQITDATIKISVPEQRPQSC